MLLIFLLMVACCPCLALQLNQNVSRERAKELGVTIRSNMDGENGVKVCGWSLCPRVAELYARWIWKSTRTASERGLRLL
jgi:hypothetical protein